MAAGVAVTSPLPVPSVVCLYLLGSSRLGSGLGVPGASTTATTTTRATDPATSAAPTSASAASSASSGAAATTLVADARDIDQNVADDAEVIPGQRPPEGGDEPG